MSPPILPVQEIDTSFYADLSVNMELKMTSPPSTAERADSMVVDVDKDADSMAVDSDDNDTDIDDDNDADSMEEDGGDSLSKKTPFKTCDIRGREENAGNSGGRIPMHASLAEVAEDISKMGGRDGYVKALAGNPGYTRDKSRKRSDYDNDGIIYVILNRRNLKVYVGKTDNVDVRFREHLSGNGGARVLQSAIKKYGRKMFVGVILLAGIQDQTELASAEIAAIEHLDCLTTGKRGYNIQLGGEGGKHAPETKAAMSAAAKLRHAAMDLEERAASRAANRAVVSAAMKLWHASATAEKKAAMSAANSAAHKLWHASLDPEKKSAIGAAISASLKGKARSPEAREAMSAGSAKKKSVVITLLETDVEIVCTSLRNAAREMGIGRQTIGNLVNNINKKSTSKGGVYAGQKFTARFRDK